jgi:NAD(P)-dependent dehydrogenase (short-subunit alcohol dehydrogenase family)
MTELRFDGRVAIVTGGGRGVGREHCLSLAKRGAKVVVADYGGSLKGDGGGTKGPAEDVVAEIKAAGGEAIGCYASVAEKKGAASIVEAAMDSFGKIDVIINNAGISDPKLFEDADIDLFDRMVAVHLLGGIYVVKYAYPHMQKAKYGRIVNTCSEGPLGIHMTNTAYGAAKAGMWGFTRTLAAESTRFGIHVNGFSPRAFTRLGSVEAVAVSYGITEDAVRAQGAITRMDPALASPAAVFLVHETCKLNGEILVAGGGQVLRMCFYENQGALLEKVNLETISDNLDKIMDMSQSFAMPIFDPLKSPFSGQH